MKIEKERVDLKQSNLAVTPLCATDDAIYLQLSVSQTEPRPFHKNSTLIRLYKPCEDVSTYRLNIAVYRSTEFLRVSGIQRS